MSIPRQRTSLPEEPAAPAGHSQALTDVADYLGVPEPAAAQLFPTIVRCWDHYLASGVFGTHPVHDVHAIEAIVAANFWADPAARSA